MVITCKETKTKRKNYFMTDKEAAILWQWGKRYSTEFQVMLGMALFRGMRIGEIVAMNIYDFEDSEFQNVRIILEKSHIDDKFPILKDFSIILQDYIMHNKHRMTDGYLFPYYSSRKKAPHMTAQNASALFNALRAKIAVKHPEFAELSGAKYKNKEGKIFRYRINWHSCRRWFETRIWDRYKNKMMLRDIQRYSKSSTVDVYIDPYEVWKNESTILDTTFAPLFAEFNSRARGQATLQAFF